MTLDYLCVLQQKVAAFASGMHARLGAASGVSWRQIAATNMLSKNISIARLNFSSLLNFSTNLNL